MSKIKILQENVVSQIAAGEVIETPASVIKELIENSIDAQATNIEISIINNGMQLIKVVDDGVGMSKDDLLLCCKVHATSKIANQFDLHHINTLGFRGEALASIVNVSLCEIASNNGNAGYCYGVNNDALSEGYASKGTSITINNLFYNVPARFKFLASHNRIYADIVELIYGFVLMYPQIAFIFNSDGKEIIRTNGNDNSIEILNAIYGLAIAENMNYLEATDDSFRITGYYSNKDISRANKRAIYLFINKRLISDKIITQAVIDGYGTLLMERRFPIIVLNIVCDSQLVDVNVHPAKKEVRLDKRNDLCNLITTTLSKELKRRQSLFNSVVKDENMSFDFHDSKSEQQKIKNNEAVTAKINHNMKENSELLYQNTTVPASINEPNNTAYVASKQVQKELKNETETNYEAYFFEVIGQFAGTYLLISTKKGLQIIDQHAAMERINYEHIKASFNRELTYYDLITPVIIKLNFAEAMRIMEFKDTLKELGLAFELQPNNDLLIRSIPSWIDESRVQTMLESIIEQVLTYQKIVPFNIVKDDLIMASCKMSLKANNKLSQDEIRALVNRLLNCPDNDHCPHGRPIFVTLTLNDLEKMFKRIV